VFDLLKLGDVDLRSEPLLKRKKLLERLVKGHPCILYVDHMEREGLAMFAGALALGLEGVVAKDSKSPYRSGVQDYPYLRSHLW
jgi:bifunctional non-homologous end joining protein LigD